MKRIESFKTFSQLQTQLKEEARQKEIASKREASSVAFNELLSKYGVASISDLNEEERTSFLKELQEGKLDSYYQMTAAKRLAKKDGYDFDKLPKYDRTSDKHQEYYLELAANESEEVEEGNAFSAARAKAIADGKKEFTVDGETYPVEDVDKEDKENAEEFVDESELVNENRYAKAGKLGYNDQFLNKKKSLAKTLSNELGLTKEFVGPFLGFDYVSLYAVGPGNIGGTILGDALTGKYTYDDLKSAAAAYLKDKGVDISEAEDVNLDFESVEERNAFIFAAAQAKKDGKKRFTFNGKTYPVTLKVDLLK